MTSLILVALVVVGIVAGSYLSVQGMLILTAVLVAAILWGAIFMKKVDGLPGAIGMIPIAGGVPILVAMWITYYVTTGQTFVQDLFANWHLELLR